MTTAGILIYVIKEAVKMHVGLQPVGRMPSVIVTGMKGTANVLMGLLGILFKHVKNVSIYILSYKHVSPPIILLNDSGPNN